MPYPDFQRELNPGQRMNLRWANELVTQKNETSRYFSDITQEMENKLGPGVITNIYLGVITNSGPNSEKDYTDCRYWVVLQILDSKLLNTSTQQVQTVPNPRWTSFNLTGQDGQIVAPSNFKANNIVTATNINEMPDSPGKFENAVLNGTNVTYTTVSSTCGSHLLYTIPTTINPTKYNNSTAASANNKTNTFLVYECHTIANPDALFYVFSQEPERWKIAELAVHGSPVAGTSNTTVDCTNFGTSSSFVLSSSLYTYDLFDYIPPTTNTHSNNGVFLGPPLVNWTSSGSQTATSVSPIMQRWPGTYAGAGVKQSYIVPARYGIANYCQFNGECPKWHLVWCDEVTPEPVLVTLTVDSGTQGTDSTPASWTYTFKDAQNGLTLGSNQTPLWFVNMGTNGRQNGPVTQGTIGWAEYLACFPPTDYVAQWTLIEANELLITQMCST